ncbi:MAG: glycyl-radical enzyme activating protein [Clostridia bacterium]|nr:glycyl-radical enzyme activating protein [Clostridia bacterium]
MGTVFNIQRYCLHDGDGIRTTVFLKGCPLRCIWCHNPEGLDVKPSMSYNSDKCSLCGRCLSECKGRAIVDGRVVISRSECVLCGNCVHNCLMGANEIYGKEMTAEEVMTEVLKDRIYYKTSGGGMTLSGGEPSMQAEFALELIDIAASEGISVFIETCGIGSVDFYKRAVERNCVFLFDIKCVDSQKHKRLTGVGNEHIMDNLNFLFDNGADVIIRLPMIPILNDSDEDIAAACRILLENKGKYRYAQLMPYHTFGIAKAERLGKDSVFRSKDADDADKQRWREAFLKNGIEVKIS